MKKRVLAGLLAVLLALTTMGSLPAKASGLEKEQERTTELSPVPATGAAKEGEAEDNDSTSALETPKDPVIGKDHPEKPGDVLLFKNVEPAEGLVNTWDVTLRIEGKDTTKTSDVVLVMDTSGSMGNYGRMEAAKAAANAFVDKLLPEGQTTTNTQIAVVSFASSVSTDQGLTSQAASLKTAISGLSADGGTFTQAGIKQARDLLKKSQADYKHIVLLSDGKPTYSYELKNPDQYYEKQWDPDSQENRNATTSRAPESEYTYTSKSRVGNGSKMISGRKLHWDWFSSFYVYYNHGNSAIAEAGFARNDRCNVFTIGLQTEEEGSTVLDAMKQGEGTFTKVSAVTDLTPVFQKIAAKINAAVKDGVLTNPMGQGFQISASNVSNIRTTPEKPEASYDQETKTISWNPEVSEPIEKGSDIKYAQLTYRITIDDAILKEKAGENGSYATTENATLQYTDLTGQEKELTFPSPKVNPVLYKVQKVLQDKDKKEKKEDKDFTVKVTGPGADGEKTVRPITLNTKDGKISKIIPDLQLGKTYTFEETGVGSGYEVTYRTQNGEEVSTGKSFTVPETLTDKSPDVTIQVINKEKAGSLTITKVLDQSPVSQTAAVGPMLLAAAEPVQFSFTVIGPNKYSTTVTLPTEYGSWSTTLDGLALGEYTVTENDVSDYTTRTKVNEEEATDSKSATVTFTIDKLNQTVTFTNKQTENMKVTATKTWVNAPSTTPDIWFQLIRIANDDKKSETKIGSPKKVTGDTVSWDQSETGLEDTLLRYDDQGKPYTYKVQEVNSEGIDFVPEGYTKKEDGLSVTNTKKPISISVTKEWKDGNNQDGKRPDSVTIKLKKDTEDTDQTIVLNEANGWMGTFSDLQEYENGEKISYSVSEVDFGDKNNGYTTEITGTSETGFTVTNSRTPKTVTISGTKTWNDSNNQDGKRPTSITVHLKNGDTEVASATVTADKDWKWTFRDQPRYAKGVEINYTIEEDSVANYSSTVNGYNITNSYTPGKTSLQVTKVWEDQNNQDGIRPESVTISLLAGTEKLNKTLTLSEKNHWTDTFTELDEYQNGKKIDYTVEEASVEGYDSSVKEDTTPGAVTVTNTHTPETTTVSVKKTWVDEDNKKQTRPDKITINLLKNGKKYKSQELTEKDGWAGEFTKLPKYEKGTEIPYSISEEPVKNYKTEVKGYTVTNTYLKPTPPAPKPDPRPTPTPTPTPDQPKITVIAGPGRAETAAKVSKDYFPNANRVLLVQGMAYPDAMSAMNVSKGQYPILYVGEKHLPEVTKEEILRVPRKELIIVGGEQTISKELLTEIQDLQHGKVTRLGGLDRFATNRLSLDYFGPAKKAVLASGMVYADALSSAPYAHQEGAPILLVGPDAIPKDLAKVLGGQIPDAVLVGGRNTVSAQAKAQAEALLGKRIERIDGADRYVVSAKIAEKIHHPHYAVVSSGEKWADALTSGPLAQKMGAPILLSKRTEVPKPILDYLKSLSTWKEIFVVGGPASIGKEVHQSLKAALGLR